MSAPPTPLDGDALLVAVTEAMVALHQRYHHREPVSAKSLLLGNDLLACVMGGVDTDDRAVLPDPRFGVRRPRVTDQPGRRD